jgi:hypothetical protein
MWTVRLSRFGPPAFLMAATTSAALTEPKSLPLSPANRLHFTGPANLVGLALGAAGRDDGEATGQQVVASVAVLDLDGVTGLAQMVDLGSENQLHVRLLYRVAELNGSSATSRAFLTAIAMSRWC